MNIGPVCVVHVLALIFPSWTARSGADLHVDTREFSPRRWVFGDGCCALFAALRLQLDGALRCACALLAAQRAFPRLAGPSSSRVLGGVAACWAFSAAWAAAPLLGWGRFGCDVTGFWCELDWRPDGGARSALNALCLLFGELVPLLLACVLSAVAVRRTKRPQDEVAVDEVEEQ